MARPPKPINELSKERLRKLSPYEIQERRKRELNKVLKEPVTKRNRKTNVKKYLKNILNEDVELTNIEVIAPLINELLFVEDTINLIKVDILQFGVIDEMRSPNPLLTHYNGLIKQKALIVDKVNKALENRRKVQEQGVITSIADLLNEFEEKEI